VDNSLSDDQLASYTGAAWRFMTTILAELQIHILRS
jgi:hypothetical protein